MGCAKNLPFQGRRHGGTPGRMRWGQLHFRDAVHLISRLRRQLPLIGEAMGPLRRGNNLSVSAAPSQLPWKGSQGGLYCRRYSELGSGLSASTPERGALGFA